MSARELCELLGQDMMLPMNTGAEAVESAVKVARKWGYERKGVVPGRARIVVAGGNFHGRTTTVISFSDDEEARRGYGPYTPGFVTVPFGDLAALEAALTEDTVAVLLEPIQGEAGAVGRAVVALLATGEPQERARVMGAKLHAGLTEIAPRGLTAVRGRGLWAGIDIDPRLGTGRECCERLAAHGVLAKDAHGATVRLSPPLVITEEELERGLTALAAVLQEMAVR